MMKNALHFPHLFVWPSGKWKEERAKRKEERGKRKKEKKKTHKDCRSIFFYMNYDISLWTQLEARTGRKSQSCELK